MDKSKRNDFTHCIDPDNIEKTKCGLDITPDLPVTIEGVNYSCPECCGQTEIESFDEQPEKSPEKSPEKTQYEKDKALLKFCDTHIDHLLSQEKAIALGLEVFSRIKETIISTMQECYGVAGYGK